MAAWTVKQIKKIQGADRRSEDIATPKTTADTVRAFNAYL